MNLFQSGNFTLHSGQESAWKIDCDALTDADLDTLAQMVAQKIRFMAVVGVPTGGLRFAAALRKYVNHHDDHLPWLIVDDVLTTGKSMDEMRASLDPSQAYLGIVIFSRADYLPLWIKPIFQLAL